MAKTKTKSLTSYKNLLKAASAGFNKQIILVNVADKALIDEVIQMITKNFLGEKTDKSSLIILSPDEADMEKIINEISSGGFFAQKKIVVLKNVKALKKDEKIKLSQNLSNAGEEILFLMIATERGFKEADYEELLSEKVLVYNLAAFTEMEFMEWVKEKFEGYKISDQAVYRLLQMLNFSFDEVLSEIEKLKTYSYFNKEIDIETINECVGLSKDFAEMDFIRAVLKRNCEEAIKIYDGITLKKDVEIFLIYLLSSAFIIISKLFDPEISSIKSYEMKYKLKLWFDHEKLLPDYKSYKNSISKQKLRAAFASIHKADKILKSSNPGSKTVFTGLIEKLCSL